MAFSSPAALKSEEWIHPREEERLHRADSAHLSAADRWWVRQQNWLEIRGYRLRARYRQGWSPSWRVNRTEKWKTEDGQDRMWVSAMDATRICDNAQVVMKMLRTKDDSSSEVETARYFSSNLLASDPRNHCVPVFEIIDVPFHDIRLIVMPRLRPFNDPPFQTFGEVVPFLSQIFEGIALMHEHSYAHRDCTSLNIMLDPSRMYPNSFHPIKLDRKLNFRGKAKHFSRTLRPPRYFLIDFGLSKWYAPGVPARDDPVRGGDKSAPEHRDGFTLCDPFPTDVYYLGNLLRQEFIQKYREFDFLEALVAKMVREVPSERPPMDNVVEEIQRISDRLTEKKLRSRLVRRNEWAFLRLYLDAKHLLRTARYIASKVPAMAEP
ncbi:hypothetical protein FA95DRAFT_1590584 [Auriscalpium vulgare]|uniref:Uncharacterized protein n=1 Tax=Auriscalpium vulgare TaxID=40419 RepID=A0ACB8RGR9_9AGAM|nr:hypothetical protein FA95DRAFT_1590584 [Auriscalpium vulgare]